MKLTELILAELKQENEYTRRALELVPDGKNDWKPHPKSMPFGRLAHYGCHDAFMAFQTTVMDCGCIPWPRSQQTRSSME